MNNPLTADELKELREVVGKAVMGDGGPYRWGIEDYKAVAEHFKAKGLAEAESRVKAREIVEWLREAAVKPTAEELRGAGCSKYTDITWPLSGELVARLEAWLRGKE